MNMTRYRFDSASTATQTQEIKNSLFDQFCCHLVASGQWDSFGHEHEHLCVGHTHEDVGLSLSELESNPSVS